MISVKVEFIGTLQRSAGKRQLEVTLDELATVMSLIREIESSLKVKSGILLDKDAPVPRPSILILVNNKEISVLDGLETILKDAAIVTFIPVSHGG